MKTISTKEVSRLVGTTPQWINELVSRGVIPKVGTNSFNDEQAVQAFIRYKVSEALKKSSPDDADERYKNARADLYEQRAIEQKRKTDLLEGECVYLPILWKIIGMILSNARTRFLAIPNSCAPIVADVSNAQECFKILKDAIYEALQALADLGKAPDEALARYRESIGAEQSKTQTQEAEEL